jgi:hypothetical protein
MRSIGELAAKIVSDIAEKKEMIPRLKANLQNNDAWVRFPPEFHALEPATRVDLLKDWITEMESERNTVLRAMNKLPGC